MSGFAVELSIIAKQMKVILSHIKLFLVAIACIVMSSAALAQSQVEVIEVDPQDYAAQIILKQTQDYIEAGDILGAMSSFDYLDNLELSKQNSVRRAILQTRIAIAAGEITRAERIIADTQQQIEADSVPVSKFGVLLLRAKLQSSAGDLSGLDETLQSLSRELPNVENEDDLLEYDLYRAELRWLQRDFDIAKRSLLRVAQLAIDSGNQSVATRAMLVLGRTELELNNLETGRLYLRQADSMAILTNNTRQLLEILRLRSNLELTAGNQDDATILQDRYMRLQESLENPQAQRAVNDFFFGKDVGQSNELVEELKAENLVLQQKVERNGLLVAAVISVILILGLVLILLFRTMQRRKATFRDLQEANDDLAIERDKANQANQIKADFLSTITHELRTPMYAVTGLTHLLIENNPTQEQKDLLETLKSSADYLLSLISNILDFNKLEANKVEVELIPFGLEKRMTDLVNGLMAQDNTRGNELNLEIDRKIPLKVVGDPLKITQILINLVGNAIKFTNKGTISVRAKLVDKTEKRALVRFEVQDTGIGIPYERQEKIFEEFTQENAKTSREFGGTGLGLSIVKNLLELMGSTINLQSEPGQGSIFWFELWYDLPDYDGMNRAMMGSANDDDIAVNIPAARDIVKSRTEPILPDIESPDEVQPTFRAVHRNKPVEEPIDVTPEPEETILPTPREAEDERINKILDEQPKPTNPLAGRHILVVEDNKINQMITKRIIESREMKCDVANSGEEALQKIGKTSYDLVLMDIHMPGISGTEATRTVRETNTVLPIVALTAVTVEDNLDGFFEVGFDDVIPKPYKVNDFFQTILKVLEQTKARV